MKSKYIQCALDHQFDELVNSVKPYIKKKIPDILGYPRSSVSHRLQQQFIALEYDFFKGEALRYLKEGLGKSILDQNIIELHRFKCDTRNLSMSINFYYFIKCMYRFFVQWHVVLLICIKSLCIFPEKDKKRPKFTLVYGISDIYFSQDLADVEFVEFCKNSAINPLFEAKYLMVKSQAKGLVSSVPKHICYTRNPLYKLLEKKKLSIVEFIKFFLLHCKTFFVYLKAVFNYPTLSILFNDFSTHSLATTIVSKKLIDNILLTNSNISEQFLWMNSIIDRNFKTHMVWYSENALIYGPGACCEVFYKYIKVDEHWFWTQNFSDILHEMQVPGVFHSIGPILFYPVIKKTKSNNCISISVFDVTPISDEWSKKMGIGISYTEGQYIRFERVDYYTPEIMSKFITDVMSIAKDIESYSGKKVKIFFKPKRVYHEKHDTNYLALIEKLSGKSNELSMILVPPEENMYKMISASDFSVVMPFSSPALVSGALNVPAVYYDPVSNIDVMSGYKKMDNIIFASGKEELYVKIIDIVNAIN
jgi:polysaccharide biosynthesis PFTS motif protein